MPTPSSSMLSQEALTLPNVLSGGAVVASNGSRIPTNKLNKILEVIIDNHFYICLKWKEMFGQDTLAFYC